MKQKNWHWLRSMPINLHQLRNRIQKSLIAKGDESSSNTSLILLSHALQQPKTWLLAHSEYEPTPDQIQFLQTLTDQYLKGVPLPYLLGEWEFFGRKFIVTPDVLIPRPETEHLVESALDYLQSIESPLIVDVGTGSGAIAVSLAAECPSARVIAVDLSKPALTIAQRNARRLGQSQVDFLQTDLLSSLHTKFNLICANLPYIPSETLDTLEVARWEPRLALDGGISGLEDIRRLLIQARSRLSTPGALLMEIDASLGSESLSTAREILPQANCSLLKDLAGRDRIIKILQK